MKIPSFLCCKQTNSSQSVRPEKQEVCKKPPTPPVGRMDSAHFSSRSSGPERQARALAKTIIQDLDAPSSKEKLETLRRQLSSGTYSPNPQAIADGILGRRAD